MRNPPFCLAGMAFCLMAVPELSAQTGPLSTSDQSNTTSVYAPASGSSTNSSALARTFTVTREFSSTDDVATIDVLKGSVSYQVYVRTSPDAPWKLVETKTGLIDASEIEAELSFPDSHELKIMVTADCADCASVVFR